MDAIKYTAKAWYGLAMAAGADAANRRMRREGRSQWDAGDFVEAADTTAVMLARHPAYKLAA